MPQESPLTIRWNQMALNAIKLCSTSPPLAARMLAMTHTAIYDAWSVYDKHAISTSTAKLIKRKCDPESTEILKAISYAAFRVLTHCFWVTLPADNRNMFRNFMYQCHYDPDDCSYDTISPQGIGNLIGKLINESRRGDHSNQEGILYFAAPWSDFTGYAPRNPPYPEPVKDVNHWQPQTGSDGRAQNFLVSQWSLVKPFALKHAWQFRPPAPFNVNQKEFRKQVEEVYTISENLSPQQKAISEYWADAAGTVTPPGHWCEIAQYVADSNCRDYDEESCVKLFFALSNTLLDASIACWDAKRKYDSVRPVTAIRSLLQKPAWNSYIPTPPFPEHVSGHSTFSRAASIILRNFTGSDVFGATGVIEKASSPYEAGKPDEDIVLPMWDTFTAAAEQAGMSRLLGGIHFRKGNEDGLLLGMDVGNCVWEKALFYFNDK